MAASPFAEGAVQTPTTSRWRRPWRHAVALAMVAGSLALVMLQRPFAQDPNYHGFADNRALLGIANFANVASNLPFLLVGIAGLAVALRTDSPLRSGWMVLFAGVTLVSAGSAYYHWDPGDATLVWDRLPMTVGFMGLFAALVGEYIDERLGRLLLVPALATGLFSVLYGYWAGDLRLYFSIQLLPLVTIPLVMIVYDARYSLQWLLIAALSWYGLAKIAELYDAQIFVLTGRSVSGHSLKHLLAAMAGLMLVWMLLRRKAIRAPA